jgi:hypothetical protein
LDTNKTRSLRESRLVDVVLDAVVDVFSGTVLDVVGAREVLVVRSTSWGAPLREKPTPS